MIYWISSHFYDMEKNESLVNDLVAFINCLNMQKKEEWLSAMVTQIQPILTAKYDELNKENLRVKNFNQCINEASINGLIYKKFAKNSVFEFAIEEIAGQFAILDYENFKKVKPPELLKKNWESEKALELAPNIIKITERSQSIL